MKNASTDLLGVDIGGTNVKIGVIDSEYNVKEFIKFKTEKDDVDMFIAGFSDEMIHLVCIAVSVDQKNAVSSDLQNQLFRKIIIPVVVSFNTDERPDLIR